MPRYFCAVIDPCTKPLKPSTMHLHQDEQKLFHTHRDKIILTNERICMNDKSYGRAYSITIFLEDISSVETRYKSSPGWLFVAVLCLCYGLFGLVYAGSITALTITMLTGLLCLAFWWFSRTHRVSIQAHSGKALEFLAGTFSEEQLTRFIDTLLQAKARRSRELLSGARAIAV